MPWDKEKVWSLLLSLALQKWTKNFLKVYSMTQLKILLQFMLINFFSRYQSPIEPLLPHLINHSSSRNKSARSSGSLLLEDGQLALPKTFVTRKGAILLFTPSDEVCNHSNEESHFKKENVFEAGLKLRTVGNLTNSVLEFGKEVRL